MANLTNEQKELLQQMRERFNGCPLFEGREKGKLDDVEGEELTIAQIYPLQDYHCIIFEQHDDLFFLTGGALKDLCNEFPPDMVIGRVIKLMPMVKTKSRRDFRPIQILA